MIVTDKVVFIHSPRTGGNSFEEGLINCGIDFLKFERHTGARYIKKYIGNQSFYLTLRNPFDQLISRYEYAVSTNLKERKFEKYTAYRHWLNPIWDDNIEMFLKNYIDSAVPHITEEFNVIANYNYVKYINHSRFNETIDFIMHKKHGVENFSKNMPKSKNTFKKSYEGIEYLRAPIEDLESTIVFLLNNRTIWQRRMIT